MKKFIIAICAMMFVPISSMAGSIMYDTNKDAESMIESNGVKFRSTQRLRSRDGYSIYLYTSGKCQMYAGDRLVAETTYDVYPNGEVRLYDENGRTLYKGSYRMKSDGQNLSSLTIQGTTYYAF